jgi:hypothetical protein
MYIIQPNCKIVTEEVLRSDTRDWHLGSLQKLPLQVSYEINFV